MSWYVSAGWPVSLLEKLDLTDLLQKWPQEVLPLAAPVGHLTARWADSMHNALQGRRAVWQLAATPGCTVGCTWLHSSVQRWYT